MSEEFDCEHGLRPRSCRLSHRSGCLLKSHPELRWAEGGPRRDTAAREDRCRTSRRRELLTKPPPVSWRRVNGLNRPFSDQFGPRSNKSGTHEAFDKSPEGALLAAAHFLMDSQDENVNYEQLMRARLFEDEASRSLLDGGVLERIPEDAPVEIVGATVNSHAPDLVEVHLAVKESGAGPDDLEDLPHVLRWAQNDWRVVLLDEEHDARRRSPTLNEYMSWSAS